MRSIPFGLAIVLGLMPTQIGYQDFIALLVRQPEVSQRARAHMMASPFGTIHAATFSFPQPIGTAIPPPPQHVRLASLDLSDTEITGSIARDFTGTPMVRTQIEFPVVNRRLKGGRLVARPRNGPSSDGGGSRDLTPGRVKTVSFPRPAETPAIAPAPSPEAAAPWGLDAEEYAVTSPVGPQPGPVTDEADRIIEPASVNVPAAAPAPEVAVAPAVAAPAADNIAAAPAEAAASTPSKPAALPIGKAAAPSEKVAASPQDQDAGPAADKIAALPTDRSEAPARDQIAASDSDKASVADKAAAKPTGRPAALASEERAVSALSDDAGSALQPAPDRVAAPKNPAVAPPSPIDDTKTTTGGPPADPIDDSNTAVRLARLYFGDHPVGKNIGPIEPWPEHQELHIQMPPAADPDIKRSAIEPPPEPTAEELKSGDVAPDSGETVARKGQVTGPGKLPKTPAERLGLDAKARAKAEKCLAEAVYFESRGEPKRGQIAVAQVVMNRVFSGFYPTNVCGVVYQNSHRKLACQFTFACDNVPDVINEPDMWQQAKQISRDMLDGKLWLAEVGHSTHYHAYWVHPSWVREMRKLDKIGVHKFYRPRAWGDGSDVPPLNESQMLLTPSEAATKAKL